MTNFMADGSFVLCASFLNVKCGLTTGIRLACHATVGGNLLLRDLLQGENMHYKEAVEIQTI